MEDAAAHFLSTQGYSVIPLAGARVAIQRMRAGHFPDRDGTCAPLPSAAGYFEVRYADMATASLDLRCSAQPPPWAAGEPFEPGCVLSLSILDGQVVTNLYEVRAGLGAPISEIVSAIEGGGLVEVPIPERAAEDQARRAWWLQDAER